MKIENQICTLEQAKRLKELGVEIKCAFGFIKIPDNGVHVYCYWRDNEYALINADIVMFIGNGKDRWYAPTVAELGCMLPTGCFTMKNIDGTFQTLGGKYVSWIRGNTEAESRTGKLIYLLENNLITAEEINKRFETA